MKRGRHWTRGDVIKVLNELSREGKVARFRTNPEAGSGEPYVTVEVPPGSDPVHIVDLIRSPLSRSEDLQILVLPLEPS